MSCTESKMLSGEWPSSTSTALMILGVSSFREAAPAQKVASILVGPHDPMGSRAAFMPLMKGRATISKLNRARGRFIHRANREARILL